MDKDLPAHGVLLSVALGLFFLNCPVSAAIVLFVGAGLGLLVNLVWIAKQ